VYAISKRSVSERARSTSFATEATPFLFDECAHGAIWIGCICEGKTKRRKKNFLMKARARALYDFRVVDTRAKTLSRANNKPQEAQVILP
jgi:hypothetical protein